jgi:C-terminal processing protease CtpA/Prc
VLAVDGVPVTVLGFAAAVQRIRGPEGTQVLLRIYRNGPATDLAIERVRIRG